MDPISLTFALLSGVSSLGTGLLGASSARATGKAQAREAAYRADQLETKAQYGEIQADVTDTQLREELASMLGNIDAIRASAGADPNAPTAVAIKANETRVSSRARNLQNFVTMGQVKQDRADAKFIRATGSAYASAGNINAGASILSSLGSLAGGFASWRPSARSAV